MRTILIHIQLDAQCLENFTGVDHASFVMRFLVKNVQVLLIVSVIF